MTLEERNSLVLAHEPLVWKLAHRWAYRTKNRVLAEDFAQAGFERLLRHADDYSPETGAFATFAIKVAGRGMWRLADHERRGGLTPSKSHSDAVRPESLNVPACEDEASESKLDLLPGLDCTHKVVCMRELGAHLSTAVAELKPDFREAITETFGKGVPVEETASRLCIPLRTFTSRNTRALRALESSLAPRRLALMGLAS